MTETLHRGCPGAVRREQIESARVPSTEEEVALRALVIEDAPDIARAISTCLSRLGLSVDVSENGSEGIWRATEGHYALIVLDLMLPGMSGEAVCKTLRQRGVATPILVLTAKTADIDEINALTLGADDFIRKPFSIDVLAARATAVMRRGQPREEPPTFAGIRFDPHTHECEVDDRIVHLTPRETQVLTTLIHAGPRPVSKTELLHSVWGLDFEGDANVVDVYIRYLRQKLGSDRVITIPRTGYRLAEAADVAGSPDPSTSTAGSSLLEG